MITQTLGIGLDPFSLCVVRLDIFRDHRHLAVGTGFLWNESEEDFLITCWHNVSGTNNLTKHSISRTGARPDTFAVRFIRHDTSLSLYLNLGLRDAEGRPKWLIHPEMGSEADVVAVPLPRRLSPQSINTYVGELSEHRLKLDIGRDVFVIGYPVGIDRVGSPIWKRGSLASEVDTAQHPAHRNWLIDCATREGLSGAPVMLRQWAPFEDETGQTYGGGHGTRLIGVYSGRLATKDPFGAHLGVVWPRSVIEEIVTHRRIDDFSP